MKRVIFGKRPIGLLLALLIPLTGCCQQQKRILQQRNDSLMQEVRDLEDQRNYTKYELLNVKEQYELLRRAALGGEADTSTSRSPVRQNPASGSGSSGDLPSGPIPPMLFEPPNPMAPEWDGMPAPGGVSHTPGNPSTIASTAVSPLVSEWPSEPSPPTDFLSIEQASNRTMETESPEATHVSFEEYAPPFVSGPGWQSAN
jgi:hypothetical protein